MEKVSCRHLDGRDRDAGRGPSGAAAAGGRRRLQGRQVQGRRHRHGLQADQADLRARRQRARCSRAARWSARRPEPASPAGRCPYVLRSEWGSGARHSGLHSRFIRWGCLGIHRRLGPERRRSRPAAVHGVGRPDADLRHDGRAQFRPRLVLHARRLRRLHLHAPRRLLARADRWRRSSPGLAASWSSATCCAACTNTGTRTSCC